MATAAAAPHAAPTALRAGRARLEAVPAPGEEQSLGDGLLSPRWLEAWLGIRASQLEDLEARGELLAIRGPGGDPGYPVWQFGPDGSVLAGTRRVLAAAAASGVEPGRLHSLMAARVGLAGGSRLAALLRAGHDDHVVATVRAAAAT